MLLHKLSWIFNHKISGYTDDANGYYKRRFAAEWTTVLGPPPKQAPGVPRPRHLHQRVRRLAPALVDAPGSLAQVIATNPGVETLVKRLRDEAKITELGMGLLDRYEIFRGVKNSLCRRLFESDPEFDKENYFRPLGSAGGRSLARRRLAAAAHVRAGHGAARSLPHVALGHGAVHPQVRPDRLAPRLLRTRCTGPPRASRVACCA